jgi:hypothetical protein
MSTNRTASGTAGRQRVTAAHMLLRISLVGFGVVMLLLYPISLFWPSGWAWHGGAPHHSQYFMMIVGVYATLGAFLVNAARNPRAHLTLIWFAVWSSAVHGGVMAVQSVGHGDHREHLLGDVPALLLVAVVLSVLVKAAGPDPGSRAAADAEIA